ncbi:9b9b429e-9296-40a7-bf8e-1e283b2d0a4b [Thermothielavioides terrestris]|uniref:9b9b429e-9296-40a7-bf8e-1e283b2d0a4b n=2 Tax=Thermothielavioides terrestris TaxID=2587410 RepID=A0A446BD56_9PEZI|nr:9b9b429e-9296-40a7-bf8e-1e283b2d0a4b [Thermothielavioides terrestris]
MHGPRRTKQLDRTIQIIQGIQSLAVMTSNGMTALMQAIDFQDYDVTAALLRAAPELAATRFASPSDPHIFNLPIHFAAQIASQRDVPDTLEIPELINSYAQQLDPSTAPPRDHAGRTPLHLAATGQSNLVVGWLLEKRPGLLYVEDDLGRTPLHYCTSAATCRFLLQRGAIVDHTDKNGMTALHRACLGGASELVLSLLEARPQLSLRNNKYGTPLHCGVISSSAEVVRALIEARAPLDATDQFGNTAVHVAVKLDRRQILRTLTQAGANTRLRNARGRDALMIAQEEGRLEIADMLRAISSKLDMKEVEPHLPENYLDRRDQHDIRKTGSDRLEFPWDDGEAATRAEPWADSLGEDGHDADQDGENDKDEPRDTNMVREAIMVTIHRTVKSFRALGICVEPLERQFVEPLTKSSFAFNDSDLWRSDLASGAAGVMAKTAHDLASLFTKEFALGRNIPVPSRIRVNGADAGKSETDIRDDGNKFDSSDDVEDAVNVEKHGQKDNDNMQYDEDVYSTALPREYCRCREGFSRDAGHMRRCI